MTATGNPTDPAKTLSKLSDQKFLVKKSDGHDGQQRNHQHQSDIILPHSSRLPKKKIIKTALITGRNLLNAREQTNADGKKRGQHQPQSCVFLQSGRLNDQGHQRASDQSGQGGTYKNRQRILAHVPHEPQRHPWQHCM